MLLLRTSALLLISCVVHATYLKDRRPPEYIINLDLPEQERWNAVVSDFKYDAKFLNTILAELMPKDLVPLVEKIATGVDKYLPSPFADEIRGIAKGLGVPVGEVVIANIIYDLTAFCTSIVAQDSHGHIWHGRNLDYRYTAILRNITIVAHFQKSGKTLYSAVTYAGYVGILTGQKPNSFTITTDARHKGEDFWKNALVAILDRNASFLSFLIRQTLQESRSYTEAVIKLGYSITIAPAYYIVGGIHRGQGVVITKDRLAPRDIWFLDSNQGRWYLVETNYDHWEEPPTTDNRRIPAMKFMNATGQANIDDRTLYKILSTPPLLRSMTTYTTLMSAARPQVFNSWVRDKNRP
ncbi:N-acylethanolamine-hydrolyzing acid amidase [Lamellibrachia satsuma]|nr:N-acylethanolamine-hydrolyzing acid amidase [Lamellibrachia satsuma]